MKKENLRKCKFQTYSWKTKEWSPVMNGLFHCWGCYFYEFDNGAGNYTTAIIEDMDGKIHTFDNGYDQFSKIQFIDSFWSPHLDPREEDKET